MDTRRIAAYLLAGVLALGLALTALLVRRHWRARHHMRYGRRRR